MLKLLLDITRNVPTFSEIVSRSLRTRAQQANRQSQQIAHLYYRVEQLSQDSDALKGELSDRWELLVEEKLAAAESEKLQYAVLAAKHGTSSLAIAEMFGLLEAEAELIVSIHGPQLLVPIEKLH